MRGGEKKKMKAGKFKAKSWLAGLILGAGALALAGTFGVKAIRADEANYLPPFISGLIEKFNLDESEVKTYFDEMTEARRERWQQAREEKLDQAVEGGVITAEQKEFLEAKFEERRQERFKHQEEMKTWFEDQGIDPEAWRQVNGCGRGFGRHDGFGGKGMRVL